MSLWNGIIMRNIEERVLLDTTIACYIYEIKFWDDNLELDNTCNRCRETMRLRI